MWRRLWIDVDEHNELLGCGVDWKDDDGRTVEVLVIPPDRGDRPASALFELMAAERRQTELPFG